MGLQKHQSTKQEQLFKTWKRKGVVTTEGNNKRIEHPLLKIKKRVKFSCYFHAPHTDTDTPKKERKSTHSMERDFRYIIHHPVDDKTRRGKKNPPWTATDAMQVKHHKATSLLISAMEEKRQNNESIDYWIEYTNCLFLILLLEWKVHQTGTICHARGQTILGVSSRRCFLPWFDSNGCFPPPCSPFCSTERLQHCLSLKSKPTNPVVEEKWCAAGKFS